MQFFRSARWFLMALLLSIVPASSYAGVFISVGFAPPPLVVYEQPPCPQPGLMWTPGYWAYGEDGYYWVPGTWVPAPYEGALWTPGYWGFETGLYMWHPGYWGRHVGYYGGVNYGFGYMGIGFAGGLWRGHDFVYNTAVVHVNNVYVHNTYIDRTVVERNTIVNERHVAFSGGPGGINHAPAPEERMAMRDQHMAPTSFQTQHRDAAMSDHNAYFRNNGGHPQNLAVERPMVHDNHEGPSNAMRPTEPNTFHDNRGGNGQPNQYHSAPQNTYHPAPQNNYHPAPQYQAPHNTNEFHPQNQPRPESHPAPQGQPHNNEGKPQGRPEHDNHDHGKGR